MGTGALPEQQLLVACGVAPRGKLAAVRSGCGLLPAMLDGPELPVSSFTVACDLGISSFVDWCCDSLAALNCCPWSLLPEV